MAKDQNDAKGSTTHEGAKKNYTGKRGAPEAAEVKSGRGQEALRNSTRDDVQHWDMRRDSEPHDSARYRTFGTSGHVFVEGSGSLRRELPSAQWASNTDPEHPYAKYDHSPDRGDKRDPVPQPSREPYYVGARNSEAPTNTTRATRHSEGRVSTPDAGVFHNKDEKKQGINMGDRPEHTSAPTDPQRRETSIKAENKVLDCEQKERGTKDSDALLKQLGRNGYRAN